MERTSKTGSPDVYINLLLESRLEMEIRRMVPRRDSPGVEANLRQTATAATSEEVSLALVALYNATNGPGWTDNAGWLVEPVSQWNGVTLNADGRAIGLHLFNRGLSGELPWRSVILRCWRISTSTAIN